LIIDVCIVFQTQQLLFLLNSLFNFESIAPTGLLLFGLFIGLRHAIEPDHLAAISTIVTLYKDNNKIFYRIPLLGALWGLGHTLALLAS
jgi:high-affinity nickel permease